jgi:uncharacterized Tic20 family protein
MASELPNFQEYAQEPATTGHASYKTDEKQWAMYAHMSALIGVLFLGALMFVGPLVVWIQKRDTSPFVAANGKEALNFQLTMLIPFVITVLLAATISSYLLILTIGAALYSGVMAVIAGKEAGEGKMYQYPATLRIIQ